MTGKSYNQCQAVGAKAIILTIIIRLFLARILDKNVLVSLSFVKYADPPVSLS